MIKILISWMVEDEINRALEIRNIIDDALDQHGLHAGTRTVNDPHRTFGILVPPVTFLKEEKMTIETGIYVELLGHRAKITNIYGHLADGFRRKEDYLVVYLEFEETVDSLMGLTFHLPAKLYGKDEFLAAVVEKGERRLAERLEENREEGERVRLKEQQRGKLDSIVADIKSTIGLVV